MTKTTRKLITELEETIQRLPEEEQKERVASYLADAKQREHEDAEVEPYSSFTFLEEANLDLPEDYSETYEEHLYGSEASADE
jgi:hypothetical protein